METSKKVKQQKKKVLLMGKSGAGKSSMRSIIFSNHVAKDVRRLGATIDVDKKRVKFLGNLLLDIWDCGGQDAFTESYLTSQKSYVFGDVGVLIYVFDVESSDFTDGARGHSDRDLQTYGAIIAALDEYSPNARIFTLVHKMDLVANEYRNEVIRSKTAAITARSGRFARRIGTYATSIWDETLYRAWGSIVNSLIPNLDIVEDGLKDLQRVTEAEEVVLFEQNTFLTVTRVSSEIGDENPRGDRYERLSNIIKTFKNSLSGYTESNSSHQFDSFTIKTGIFNLIINRLTYNTYVLVVLPPGEAELQCARLNILSAKDEFARIESVAEGADDDFRNLRGK
ncbi:GTP-binding protein gtr1 [Xanthoria calcicola]